VEQNIRMSQATYDCDSCGACCKTFPIFASEADACREPRLRAEAGLLPVSYQTAQWKYRLHPLPFLETCCFLDSDNRCSIYATRPDVCRRFAAGSEQCQQARERQGLSVLLPL
jgi:Fe-S-cluster containining protein